MSVTGQTKTQQHGFTLLEILVVMALLLILTGAAMLSVGLVDDSGKLQRETQRLAQLIRLQCEQSQLQGIRAGLQLQADGYVFARWFDERWHIQEQPPFQLRQFPIASQLDLRVAGHRLATPEPITEQIDEEITPQIVCFESGELTPFSLGLSPANDPATTFRLTGQINGDIATETNTTERI